MSLRHLGRRLSQVETKTKLERESPVNPMALIAYARGILDKVDQWEKETGMDCLTAKANDILPDNMTEEEFQIAVDAKKLILEENAECQAEALAVENA